MLCLCCIGVVYSEGCLRQLNELCQERNIYHISDEAYEYFTYDDTKHVSPGSFTNSHKHTISLFSLSKAFGFASWRIGYMVIPHHLLESIQKIQDTILICPTVIAQYGALGALEAPDEYIQDNIQQISKVRKVVIEALQTVKDLCEITVGDGAFYFFIKVNTQMKDIDLVKRLINEFKVAVLPGSTFGIENGCYVRVAYGALQEATATEGINRFVSGLRVILSTAEDTVDMKSSV